MENLDASGMTWIGAGQTCADAPAKTQMGQNFLPDTYKATGNHLGTHHSAPKTSVSSTAAQVSE